MRKIALHTAAFQRHCHYSGPVAQRSSHHPLKAAGNISLDHTGKITVLIEELTSEGDISASAGAGLYWLIFRSPDICQTGISTGQIAG